MPETIEGRLTRLEEQFARLRARPDASRPGWFSEVNGTLQDDPEFDDVLSPGRDIRNAEAVEYSDQSVGGSACL